MNHRVTPKARELIAQTWQSQANLALFLAMLVVTVFVLPAINVKHEHIVLYSNIVYSLVLASGVAIGWGRPRLFALAAVVASPALVLRWAAWGVSTPALELWAEAFSLLSVVVIAYVLLAQVFRAGPINAVRVQGAVAVYLLIGVAYAYGFQIDSRINPASVESTAGKMTTFVDWVYFSFCTLSTVGYGDIVPASRLSRMLAIGEGISGQLFLAILIARLVAMQVSAAAERQASN